MLRSRQSEIFLAMSFERKIGMRLRSFMISLLIALANCELASASEKLAASTPGHVKSSRSGSQLPDRLQRVESADFARAAARAEMEPRYRKRGLGFDFEGATPGPHFYTWTIIPTWGQGVIYYAVDRRTGEVWPYFGCKRIQSPELAALQARFRRHFKVPAWRVRQIEREGNPNVGADC